MDNRPVYVSDHAVKRYAERFLGMTDVEVSRLSVDILERCHAGIRRVVRGGEPLTWPENLVFFKKFGKQIARMGKGRLTLSTLISSIQPHDRRELEDTEFFLLDDQIVVLRDNRALTFFRAREHQLSSLKTVRAMYPLPDSEKGRKAGRPGNEQGIYFISLDLARLLPERTLIKALKDIGWQQDSEVYILTWLSGRYVRVEAEAEFKLLSSRRCGWFFHALFASDPRKKAIILCDRKFTANGIKRLVRLHGGGQDHNVHVIPDTIFRLDMESWTMDLFFL